MELVILLLLAGDIGFACGYWNSLSDGAYGTSLNTEGPYRSPFSQANDALDVSPNSAANPMSQDERLGAGDKVSMRNFDFPRVSGFDTSAFGKSAFGNNVFGNSAFGNKPFGNNAFANTGFTNNGFDIASYPGEVMDFPRPPSRPPSTTELCEDFVDQTCKFVSAYFCKNDLICKRKMNILQHKVGIIGHAVCAIL